MIKTRRLPVCSYSNNIDYVLKLREKIAGEFLAGKTTYGRLLEIKDVICIFENNSKNDLVYANEREASLILAYITDKEGEENGEQDNLQTQYGDYSDINRGNDRSAC